jgi:hypothetical protein
LVVPQRKSALVRALLEDGHGDLTGEGRDGEGEEQGMGGGCWLWREEGKPWGCMKRGFRPAVFFVLLLCCCLVRAVWRKEGEEKREKRKRRKERENENEKNKR